MPTHSTWRALSTALITSILFFCLVVSNRASKNIPSESPVQNSDQVRQALLGTIYPQLSCPRSTTIAQDDDLAARFSLDHRDNAARLEFQGREPLDVGEGLITRIYIKTGERYASGGMLMIVRAPVTYSIAPVRPGGPDTRTTEEDIRIKSTARGTITKILVREGQRIHHNHLLATIHKE
jgi:acetyl/propionyl-CoA carboxylase alpha subunit